MTVRLHRGDLPDLSRYTNSVAIDTETMGLHPHRDRLCVVQLSNGDGSADVVQIPKEHTDAPNLKALLADPKITKIFHFARFDLAALYNTFGVMPQPVYCTKIASRLCAHLHRSPRPEGPGARGAQHRSVEAAAIERLGLANPERGATGLCGLRRAASACACANASMSMLAREDRIALAQACFDFLPTRAKLDLDGWDTEDIFAHS